MIIVDDENGVTEDYFEIFSDDEEDNNLVVIRKINDKFFFTAQRMVNDKELEVIQNKLAMLND